MANSTFDTILVIGNGFDLNLGLPTSYNDFIESQHFDRLIHARNSLCLHLKNKTELYNWIDIENELKVYSNLLKDDSRDAFYEEYLSLCSALMDYLNKIDYSIINKKSFAYTSLCGILKYKRLAVVNFNYTDSINVIAGNIDECFAKVIDVHGTAKERTIIFGVEDRAEINKEDIFLLKTASPHYRSTKLDTLLNGVETIIFFGYSLGETDHHYFFNMFSSLATPSLGESLSKRITFIHYAEKARLQLVKQVRVLTNQRISDLYNNNIITYKDVSLVSSSK